MYRAECRVVEEQNSSESRCAELVKRNNHLEARLAWAQRQACMQDVLDQLPKLPSAAVCKDSKHGAPNKSGRITGSEGAMASWEKLVEHLTKEALRARSLSAITKVSEKLTVCLLS
jgi:hypothetical protein